jgi:RTX calcium-binding nonapeptide repeat (4 copies)
MVGSIGTRVMRMPNGHISVANSWCDGQATVTNTDAIVVTGGSDDQTLNLSLANGGLRPGYTSEAGSSDEIEVTIALGPGASDLVVVEGTDGREDMILGKVETLFGPIRIINLNNAEATNDADVFMTGVEEVTLFGFGGDDRIDGEPRVSAAIGQFYDRPLTIFGGSGDDFLRGTQVNDVIYGGPGADFALGDAGSNFVDFQDGVGGNDYATGIPTTCVIDPGDICSEAAAKATSAASGALEGIESNVNNSRQAGALTAASVTCDYESSNHRVTVQMTGNIGTIVTRTATDHINVAAQWCDGKATVENTDLIVVSGDGSTQTLILNMKNGGLRPGWTNETGTSDEIEFSVSLGGSVSDEVVIQGTEGDDIIHLGRLVTQFGTFRIANLNAGEQTGVDGDVFMLDVEYASVFGYDGWDSIHGDGGYGTGVDYDRRITIFGGNGDDVLHGGTATDIIYAGEGRDQVYGSLGGDYIDTQDGGISNDLANGGPGTDTCVIDEGDICAAP